MKEAQRKALARLKAKARKAEPVSRTVKLSLNRMAEEFGINREQLRRSMLAAGHELSKERGDLWSVRQIYDAMTGADQWRRAKAREALARADKMELEAQIARKEVVELKHARGWLTNVLSSVCERIDAMPSSMSQQLVGITSVQEIHTRLQAWVDEFKHHVATMDQDLK